MGPCGQTNKAAESWSWRVRMSARARQKSAATHTNTLEPAGLNAIIRRATSLPPTCPRPVRLPQMPAMLPACRRWFLGRPRARGAGKTAAAAAAPAPTAIPRSQPFSKTLPRASPRAPPALRARRRRRGMSAMDCAQTQRARASGAAVASANGDLRGGARDYPRAARSPTADGRGGCCGVPRSAGIRCGATGRRTACACGGAGAPGGL